jgi:hypothetical protein
MQPRGIDTTSYIERSAQRGDSRPFRIGNVTKNFSEDGGCAISRSQDVWHSPLFFTSDFQNHASINIDGKDKILTLTKIEEKVPEKEPIIGEAQSIGTPVAVSRLPWSTSSPKCAHPTTNRARSVTTGRVGRERHSQVFLSARSYRYGCERCQASRKSLP